MAVEYKQYSTSASRALATALRPLYPVCGHLGSSPFSRLNASSVANLSKGRRISTLEADRPSPRSSRSPGTIHRHVFSLTLLNSGLGLAVGAEEALCSTKTERTFWPEVPFFA